MAHCHMGQASVGCASAHIQHELDAVGTPELLSPTPSPLFSPWCGSAIPRDLPLAPLPSLPLLLLLPLPLPLLLLCLGDSALVILPTAQCFCSSFL